MKVIDIHPVEVAATHTGSSLRPVKIRETFEDLKYEVFEVSGNRGNGVARYEEISKHLTACEVREYIYFESLSRPTNVRLVRKAGVKMLRSVSLDYDFLTECAERRIPIGFYLRDIHLAPEGYIKPAYSVKISEYIADGLSVIAFKGSEPGQYIEDNGIDWNIDHKEEAVRVLLLHMTADDHKTKQRNVLHRQHQVTGRKVVKRLEGKHLKQ